MSAPLSSLPLTSETYNDPYAYNGSGAAAYNYDNTPQGYGHAYDAQHNNYYAGAAGAAGAGAAAGAVAGAGAAATAAGTRNRLAPSQGHEREQRTSFHSSDNYHDPGARVQPAAQAYDYGDDYAAIGRAATSPSDPRYRTPPAPPPKSSRQAHQSLESQYTTYTQPAQAAYAPAPAPSVPPPAAAQHRKQSSGTSANSAGTMKVPQPQPSGQFYVANRTASPVSEYPGTEFSRDSEYTADTGRPPSYGQVTHQAHVYPSDQKRAF